MTYPNSPEPGGALRTLTEEQTQTSTGDGDHDRFSHYVIRNKLTEAMVEGSPLQALCGKVWVPSRDPKKYPVCPECKEIYDGIPPGEGDDPDS